MNLSAFLPTQHVPQQQQKQQSLQPAAVKRLRTPTAPACQEFFSLTVTPHQSQGSHASHRNLVQVDTSKALLIVVGDDYLPAGAAVLHHLGREGKGQGWWWSSQIKHRQRRQVDKSSGSRGHGRYYNRRVDAHVVVWRGRGKADERFTAQRSRHEDNTERATRCVFFVQMAFHANCACLEHIIHTHTHTHTADYTSRELPLQKRSPMLHTFPRTKQNYSKNKLIHFA